MATANGLDVRLGCGEGRGAPCHRVGVVDHPCIGADGHNAVGKFGHDRD
nr:hypothetical protein [uncultured Cohaesibacter sp.]